MVRNDHRGKKWRTTLKKYIMNEELLERIWKWTDDKQKKKNDDITRRIGYSEATVAVDFRMFTQRNE
jgi:hypothetical protein